MSMVKTPFRLLEMAEELVLPDATRLGQARLGDSPEALDTVDARLAVGEDVGVFDAVMPLVARVHEPVVGLPLVGEERGPFRGMGHEPLLSASALPPSNSRPPA